MEPDVRKAAPGRLPQRVYWFRRAFVVVCLAIVIGLLMWLVSLISGGARTASPTSTAGVPAQTRTPSPPGSLEATALPAPATASGSTATDLPTTASPGGASAPSCDPGVLTLSVTGPGTVKVGATAQLTVKVTNSGSDACSFTFDSRLSFRIISGSDEIWSTNDCAQWAPTGTQSLAPGASATWQTTWDRHRSQATCKVVAATLKAGTYVAEAMYAGASTAELVMNLTA